MLKEHSFLLRNLVALGDLALLAVVFFYAHRYVGHQVPLKAVTEYWFMFLGFAFFYSYFAWTRELFSVLRFPVMRGVGGRTLVIFAIAAFIGAALLYFLPDLHNSRRLYLTFVTVAALGITACKVLVRLLLMGLRKTGRNTTPVLVFGRGRGVTQLLKKISTHPEWGLRVQAVLDLSISPEQFCEVVRDTHAEEVLFWVPRSATVGGFDLDPYLDACEEIGRPARVFLNLSEATSIAHWHYQPFLERPTLVSLTIEADPDLLFFKRFVDIIVALVGVVLFALAYPFVALRAKVCGADGCIVRETRTGRSGKRYTMYSFRQSGRGDGERPGPSFHRFPQFVNVLRGDMSLVGVRPAAPTEVAQYATWHHRRLSFKPGMTGMWRVCPSRQDTLDDLVRLDLMYVDSWSLWLDLSIVVHTYLGILWNAPALSDTGSGADSAGGVV